MTWFCRISEDFHYKTEFMVTSFEHEPLELNKTLPWSHDSIKNGLYIGFLKSYSYNGTNIYYDDSSPFEPLQGCHVIIHNTDELPSSASYHFQAISRTILHLEVTPEMFLIDDDLKSWSLEKRGCYLLGEKNLTFFKKYTKKNCELECLSRSIFKACKCVPFYVIRESDYKKDPKFSNFIKF